MLRHYLDGLDKEDRLIALTDILEGDAGSVIRDFQQHFRLKNNRSTFDYNTVIVSLYGYFERYIEDLVSEYLNEISRLVSTFVELPSSIQTNHFPFSIDLARKTDQQRYVGKIRVEEIVARLHTCFTTPHQYQLNAQAFSQHSANFRHPVVVTTFSQCGIENFTQSLKQAEPFISFLRGEDPERDVDAYLRLDDDLVFFRLDDLANRRNDVAHGSPVDNRLSNDLLRTYINFVEAYAASVDLMVYERVLPFVLPEAIWLGPAIAIYNQKIVCFNFSAGTISVGDVLIAKTQDTNRPFKSSQIQEIQQEKVSVTTVEGAPGTQIGVKTELVARNNHDFYLLRAKS